MCIINHFQIFFIIFYYEIYFRTLKPTRHNLFSCHAGTIQSLIQPKNTGLGTIFSYYAETYFQTVSNFIISSYEQIKETVICITL